MRLSVVIPTWCEERLVADAVRAARQLADEVIVADPGSPDRTRARARSAGARVIDAPRGRGPQLQAGAEVATGDVLLFLHADVRLAAGARAAIDAALSDPATGGGNFRLRFVPETPAARLFTTANDLRRRLLNIYYGDSAIFVRTDVFHALGGYRPLPIFEDYDLVQRLERAGLTRYITDVTAEASARRFAHRPVRTLLVCTPTFGREGRAPDPARPTVIRHRHAPPVRPRPRPRVARTAARPAAEASRHGSRLGSGRSWCSSGSTPRCGPGTACTTSANTASASGG